MAPWVGFELLVDAFALCDPWVPNLQVMLCLYEFFERIAKYPWSLYGAEANTASHTAQSFFISHLGLELT